MDWPGYQRDLPGGLTVRQARRHVAPARSRWPAIVVCAAILVIGIAAAAAGNFGWAFVLGPIAALALFFVSLPPGVRVTAKSQPELWSAITRAAEDAGVARPRRVWLTHEAEVRVRAIRRRHELLIGLPLLIGLDGHEVRALIAHEYAQLALPRPDLVVPLARLWREAAPARSEPDPRPEELETERALRAFGLAVERAADDAATAAAGSQAAAARAIAVVDALVLMLVDLRMDLAMPGRLRWLVRNALEDADDVWCRLVQEGIEPWVWYEDIATELAHQHPDLADALRALREPDVWVRRPLVPIRLEPIGRRSRRRLARRLAGVPPLTLVRWRTVGTAPQWWWADRAEQSVDHLRRGVTRLLGRAPVDHVELAEVFIFRNDEYWAVVHPGPAEGTTQPAPAGDDTATKTETEIMAPVLLYVLEDALLARGWRLEHPFVRGVLIGLSGTRVDGRTFTKETYVDNLRDLLAMS